MWLQEHVIIVFKFIFASRTINVIFLALGQAVNLAKCVAKFPQAAVNLDRNKIYSQMIANTTESSHAKLSNEIVKDIKLGIDIFKNGMIGKRFFFSR